MRYTFPSDYDLAGCYLVPINAALLPLVAGALKHFEERRVWHSDEEYEQAYNAFAELQVCMTKLCVAELVESQNRLYRLLDSSLNGTLYTVSGAGTALDPYVFNPPIPVVPLTAPGAEPSVKFSGEKMLRLVDNLTNATTYMDAPDGRNIRQQLEDLIAKVGEGGQLDDEMLAKLIEIAALVA